MPAGKDRTKRRRVVSDVTRLVPVSVKVLNHEGFGVIRIVIGDIHGHGLIDRKAEEGGRGRRFVIIGGLNIRGSLHARGDRRKGIGAVEIHRAPGLEAGGGHHICLSHWRPSGSKWVMRKVAAGGACLWSE